MDAEDDYTEIVLTFDADFSDPNLHLQLVNLSGQLQHHLSGNKNVTVTKVEPWNSVRVTLNISKDAAVNLQRLAEEDGQLLRDLGILSVQLPGNQSVNIGDSNHNGMAAETVAKQFKETSGIETRMTYSSEPPDAGCDQRPLTSWLSFAGKQDRNSMVIPQDCFLDGSQPTEIFICPPGVRSVQDMSGCAYLMSPRSESAACYAEDPDARFGFSNNRLARSFHPVSGGAFDDVVRTRSVSQYCLSESKQSNEKILLPGRHLQSTSFALCASQPVAVDHMRHHNFSGVKSCSAQNTFSVLLQNCGSKDPGIAFSNRDSLFHRQWSYPRPSAAQRQPFKEEAMEIIPTDREVDTRRYKQIDPWWRGLSQKSKEINCGSKLAKSHDRHHQSLSSDLSLAVPVTDNYAFAPQNSFQDMHRSRETDHHLQNNFLNNQINSVPLSHLEKSHASTLCQMPFPVRPNINPDPGKQWAFDMQNGATVQSQSCGTDLCHDMSAFSPASPENSSHPEDGMFCDSASILAAESSKLAVERALSLLSDGTDETPDMPVEKKDHNSSHFDLSLSLPTGSSSHQRILGKFQANSQESDCFKTRTHLRTSVTRNRTQSFNHVVEFPQKSPSALKKTCFARTARRSVPCMNNGNADFNYFVESKSKSYDRADSYSCEGSVSKLSNVASSAMLKVKIHSSFDPRNGSNYVEGNQECGVAFSSDSNKSSKGTSFIFSPTSDPFQRDMAKVSHSPFILPCDRFALSSKSPNFNFTQSSMSVGSHITSSSSTFPPVIPAMHDSLVRFTCRAQSQDKPRTTNLEGAMASSSPRDTCSWMESDLCSSIPDSGIASNTSSGGSSDLSELERTLGGSMENFSRYQEAAEVKDGCLPGGSLEDGTDVPEGGWPVHSTISLVQNTNSTTTSHESPSTLSVCWQATSPGRTVSLANAQSYVGIHDESKTSVVLPKQDKGVLFSQCRETLKKRAPRLPEEPPSKDISARIPISKVSSTKTNSGLADVYQNSQGKRRHHQHPTSGESSSKSCFEPLITCPSLPQRLSESVKLVMQGVSSVGTSSDAFATRETPAPMEAVQASTVIRITKKKSGGMHSKQKDTWCIQPVIRCSQEKQSDEKLTSSGNSEMPLTPCSVENAKSSTAETVTLQSNNLNSSSQSVTSGRNKLSTPRSKPGKNLIFANSLRTKKLETSRSVGADRHKLWFRGQSGEFKQLGLPGSRLLAERTVQNCSRTKTKRLSCVPTRDVDF